MKIFFLLFGILIFSLNKIVCKEEFELDSNEKDKILACGELVARKHQMDQNVIIDLTNNFGAQREAANVKIAAEMLLLCYNRITEIVYKNIFNDLKFEEFEWNDELEKLVKLDYSKYRVMTDINLTPEQQLLSYKYEVAKNDFMIAKKKREEKASKSSLTIFGFDINDISSEAKMLFTILFFVLFICGVLFALMKLRKQEKPKKIRKRD